MSSVFPSTCCSFQCMCLLLYWLNLFPCILFFLIQWYMELLFFFACFLFFFWRIIALQNFFVFCQISTWIGHRYTYQFSSFQSLSRSVVSDSLQPDGLQHTRLPCPSLTPRVSSNSCPLSRWCHPTISCSVIPFSCLQSFPASGSFPMTQLFASSGQSIGASASVLPMNIQGWSPLGLTDWISLQSKGLSRVFSSTTVRKHQFFSTQPSLWSNSHSHTWLLEKP